MRRIWNILYKYHILEKPIETTPCPDNEKCGGIIYPLEQEKHAWSCQVVQMALEICPPRYGGGDSPWDEEAVGAIALAAQKFREGERPKPLGPGGQIEGWA